MFLMFLILQQKRKIKKKTKRKTDRGEKILTEK